MQAAVLSMQQLPSIAPYLQAADDARMSMRHALAEMADLPGACPAGGVLEVNVLSHLHLNKRHARLSVAINNTTVQSDALGWVEPSTCNAIQPHPGCCLGPVARPNMGHLRCSRPCGPSGLQGYLTSWSNKAAAHVGVRLRLWSCKHLITRAEPYSAKATHNGSSREAESCSSIAPPSM